MGLPLFDDVVEAAPAPPPAARDPLRDYQVEALDDGRAAFMRGLLRIIYCAPTGAGKTRIASEMAELAVAKGGRVLFIADRLTLVNQTVRAFERHGIHVGMIQADTPWDLRAPVQIASSQSLEPFLTGKKSAHDWNVQLESYALVIVDEVQTQRKAVCAALQRYRGHAVGLTATPLTDGLRDTWQGVVMVRTTDSLIDDDWLVRPTVYSCNDEAEDRSGRGPGGEWTDEESAAAMRPLKGDIVTTWRTRTAEHFGGPVPTLVFSSHINHGAELKRAFVAAGYRFEQTTAYTDRLESAAMVDRFATGDCIGLISVDKMTKGFDAPNVQCIVIARKFLRSLPLIIQMLGRGMRRTPGVLAVDDKCIVLDHGGSCAGFWPQICDFWQNGIDELPQKAVKPTRDDLAIRKERTCPACKRVITGRSCPCGWKRPEGVGRTVESVPGDLTLLEGAPADPWRDLEAIAARRYDDVTRARKWMMVNYRELTGHWPQSHTVNLQRGRRAQPNPVVERAQYNAYRRWKRRQRKQGGSGI